MKKWFESEAFPHLLVLGFCLSLIGLAVLLSPAKPQKSLLPRPDEKLQLGTYKIPETCALKRSIGLPCPGCGLTRSWVSLVHGDFPTSIEHNRLGFLVFFYAVLQVLRHGSWLMLPSFRPNLDPIGRGLDWSILLLAAGLFFNWLWILGRNYFHFF